MSTLADPDCGDIGLAAQVESRVRLSTRMTLRAELLIEVRIVKATCCTSSPSEPDIPAPSALDAPKTRRLPAPAASPSPPPPPPPTPPPCSAASRREDVSHPIMTPEKPPHGRRSRCSRWRVACSIVFSR
jgi:hypothetical protein